jgi:N-acetylated-alpha-linked acidic dipeptidase
MARPFRESTKRREHRSRARTVSDRAGAASLAGEMSAHGERAVVESVRLDDAWALVEEFAELVRESGTEDERRAVRAITSRLEAWGVPHTVHEPVCLISLPRAARLTVAGRAYAAKTPSMARSTSPEGKTARLVYERRAFAEEPDEIFAAAPGEADVAGKFVVTEGFPMPGTVVQLEERGASGVVCISPGDRIHEGICTPVWGSPDLSTYPRKPAIPVVSVSRSDGSAIVEQAKAGGVEATIVAEHEEGWVPIPVVVAEIAGAVEPERFILLHGHLDSWHVGVGDNATGDATLLEVARVLHEHREWLPRSVRVAWWSGHSHGRYAGSTWYADEYALDLERNCICHVNCDSPGCRDADAFEDVCWSAELEDFARGAIRDFTGLPAEGRPPLRAGDISFQNLGIPTFFMLSSTMPAELKRERGLYAVGGCGGNVEWHTEADTLEIADRERLLRDIRLYAGAVFRAAARPLHPLDLRKTVAQIDEAASAYGEPVDLQPLRVGLEALYESATRVETIEDARPFNDALLEIARELNRVLYAREGPYRQDPALDAPLLPELAAAARAAGTVSNGVLQTELRRARNRLEGALQRAAERARL